MMSALSRIAALQGRKDEIPNQELARELAEINDRQGIAEIAENLCNQDRNIQSDCIKVLYEVGYLKPELIAEYAGDFIGLLHNTNNRLAWGAMIALATIADTQSDLIYQKIQTVYRTLENGSVITVDNAVKVLAKVAAQKEEYRQIIFPRLLDHLRTCRPKAVAQHAESILIAVNASNRDDFIKTLELRSRSMTPAQVQRINRLYRAVQP